MQTTLDSSARQWVNDTLASLTLDEKIGHLLCPEERAYTPAEWEALLRDVPFGAVAIVNRLPEKTKVCLDAVRRYSRIPMLVAADLEHGAGAGIAGATDFPCSMAAGAAHDIDLVRAMGRATAREGRARGYHWTFAPVVDLNINFENPVTNIRSLGDDPMQVSRLAVAWIKGIQDDGLMAATAKHFPGDGVDARDQHICTSVNSYSVKQWEHTYGRVWQAAIEAGVWSIMVGHIAFPAYEGVSPREALPATLSSKLQVELLRKKLGFRGLIISDAAPMIGLSSRARADEKALLNILAGSDVFIWGDPCLNFRSLLAAVRNGRLTGERVDQSVRRVLEMKARVGLHENRRRVTLTSAEKKRFEREALAMAEKSITLLRANPQTPLKLPRGACCLTVTLRHEAGKPDTHRALPQVDRELRRRGFKVEHLERPGAAQLNARAAKADCVFINLVTYPHQEMGTMRMTAGMIFSLWESFWPSHDCVVFTSFGSPYVLYEIPHAPNMYVSYGAVQVSQIAAVKAWLGEIKPRGKCPVRLPV